jgi:hypothetical protein
MQFSFELNLLLRIMQYLGALHSLYTHSVTSFLENPGKSISRKFTPSPNTSKKVGISNLKNVRFPKNCRV